eukprot:COSAG03_NODE_83_length_13818_cov_11.329543_11_plen_66_part_00
MIQSHKAQQSDVLESVVSSVCCLLRHFPQLPWSGWGNSYSLLEGYRYARSLYAQLGSRLVYLVTC